MTLVLADTSVWVAHLRSTNPILTDLADAARLIMHPHVLGELSVGTVQDRKTFLRRLTQMDRAVSATDQEVLKMIETHRLFGLGVNWIDMHLLASTLLSDDVALWTDDRRLNALAERFGCVARLHH